ncbi:MAG: hypothetical protein Q7T18_09425 [Sedimentisphaerales bacterium]|nr:hypothetical protein [Sedimentisphaerales bacterium]
MPRSNSSSLLLKILVLAAYVAIFFFLISSLWGLLWFAVGAVCGVALLIFDEAYGRQWYQEKGEQPFLVSRSPLFLLSLIPLSVMVLTSIGNAWASGLVGGMTLWLLLEMMELRADPAVFDARFLPTIKGEVSSQTIHMMLLIGWTFFALLHIMVIL